IYTEEAPVENAIHGQSLEHLEDRVESKIRFGVVKPSLDRESPLVEAAIIVLDSRGVHECRARRVGKPEPYGDSCEAPAPDIVTRNATIDVSLERRPSQGLVGVRTGAPRVGTFPIVRRDLSVSVRFEE